MPHIEIPTSRLVCVHLNQPHAHRLEWEPSTIENLPHPDALSRTQLGEKGDEEHEKTSVKPVFDPIIPVRYNLDAANARGQAVHRPPGLVVQRRPTEMPSVVVEDVPISRGVPETDKKHEVVEHRGAHSFFYEA
jgi:hypothetical protein